MPKTEDDVVEAVREIKGSKPKHATFDMLKKKGRAKTEATFYLMDEDGVKQEISLEYRAIGAIEYDKLISKCPPTMEQRADGSSYNIHTFGPELLAAVCIDPAMTVGDWKEIWNSPDWNRGEIVQLFSTALELCNRGLDIPFTKTD